MALDRDELYRRRQQREAYRHRRKRAMYTRLAIAIAVLLACAVGIFILMKNSDPVAAPVIATETAPILEEVEETEAPTEKRASWEKEPVKIHIAAAGDLTGIRVMLNGNEDITSRCLIDTENKTVDFFIHSKYLAESFTVSVYDAEGKLCVTMTDCVKRIGAALLESDPDNVKAQAMMYYIQSIQDYLLDHDPIVEPTALGGDVGDIISF